MADQRYHQSRGPELLSRANLEIVRPDWDDQFAGIEKSVTAHYNKIWESLFENVKWWTPLGVMLKLLSRYPGNPKLIFIIRLLPGYSKRYKAYHKQIAQEESAASRFAISPETDQVRKNLGYGRRS